MAKLLGDARPQWRHTVLDEFVDGAQVHLCRVDQIGHAVCLPMPRYVQPAAFHASDIEAVARVDHQVALAFLPVSGQGRPHGTLSIRSTPPPHRHRRRHRPWIGAKVNVGHTTLAFVHRLRVIDPHLCAHEVQAASDVERWRVAHVVAIGLERGAKHGDRAARHRTAQLDVRQGRARAVGAAGSPNRPRAGTRAPGQRPTPPLAPGTRGCPWARQPPPNPRPAPRNLRPMRSS